MKATRLQLVAGLLALFFAAPTGAADATAVAASKRVKPRTEVEWEITEVVAHIAEMAVYAKTKALDPNAKVDALEAPSDKGLWIAVQTGGAQEPLVTEIATGDFTISFEAYAGVTSALLARLGLRAEGTTTSDGDALLQRLTDFTVAEIQKENERVSAWLTREPLNPAAHEETALVLGALGLKERAGTLSDPRDVCLKAAAHLALAAALRGDKPADPAGRMAREVLLARYGDDAGVADRLKAWRATGTVSPAETAWINALTLYAIGDWRLLDKPLTASLLERIMHFQALDTHINTLAALDFIRKRNTEMTADWGRIAAPYGVADGNVFAKATLMLELRDLGETYKAVKGRAPAQSDSLAAILTATPTRAVEIDDKETHLVAIPWSTWSRYFERHVVAAAVDMHTHLVRKLGLPEQGKAFRLQMEKLLNGIQLQPLAAALLVDGKVAEDRPRRDTPRWKADPETMRAAYAFIESHADRAPAWTWYYITESGATHPTGARGYHAWFAVSQAGPLDVTHSPFAAYNIDSVAEARLELLMTRTPSSCHVLSAGARRLKRAPKALSDFDQLYSRMLDTDLYAMTQRLEWLSDDTAAFDREFQKIAALDPDQWLERAENLVEKGREDDAAVAYQNGFDKGRNRVWACNESLWLVDYYLEKGKTEEARKIAVMAEEVGCSNGFEAMARFHEHQRHYEDAERFYKKMADRYADDGVALYGFYARHERDDSRFKEAAAAGLSKYFPQGLERVTLADFSGPPSDGTVVTQESGRSRAIGLTKGVVIGALDGYRVHSYPQYTLIRAMKTTPEIVVIYWDGKAWKETKGSGRARQLGNLMATYAPKN